MFRCVMRQLPRANGSVNLTFSTIVVHQITITREPSDEIIETQCDI